MKKFILILLSILMVAGLAGGAYVLLKDNITGTQIEQPNDSSTDDNTDSGNNGDNSGGNTDSGNTNSGNTDNGNPDDGGESNLPTLKGLKIPENEADYIIDGLQMQSGASLYIAEDAERPALRFSCNITSELKEAVAADDSKQVAMLVFPLKFFEQVNTGEYTYIDWVTEFDKAGLDSYYLSVFEDNFNASGDDYYFRFRLENIPYGAMNMEVCALGVIVTTNSDGSKTYQYSSFPDGVTYRSNARSVAYVASASLNAHTLGMETFDEAKLAKIKSYVNEAVDYANGLEEATNDNSKFAFSVYPSSSQNLSVGETLTLSVTVSPDVNVPIWYRSTDESVIIVDENGKITAKKAGTAVIGVYVAGEAFGITINVS